MSSRAEYAQTVIYVVRPNQIRNNALKYELTWPER